jgi:hypothetical protein
MVWAGCLPKVPTFPTHPDPFGENFEDRIAPYVISAEVEAELRTLRDEGDTAWAESLWERDQDLLTFDWKESTFACKGPLAGDVQEVEVVRLVAEEMAWDEAGQGMTWARQDRLTQPAFFGVWKNADGMFLLMHDDHIEMMLAPKQQCP